MEDFGHLMRRADSFEKPLMLGKIEGRETPRKEFVRTPGRCLPGAAGALMQLTLTVSPEALEDVGSLRLLEPPVG